MHRLRVVQTLVAVVALLALILGQGTVVLAGTTGAITGIVTDQATHAPVAGAKVTATSPSQSATTTTDASGRYSFLSLAPDTYTISVEKQGLQPYSLSGVTVQTDQSISINVAAQSALRTIGRTTARSSGSLVKSGVTSDVYNITPAQQAAAAPLGGGNNLNSVYSALQAAPGALVPISNAPGWGQSIFIRGGDYTQTGNELDGIPINRQFDQYAGSTLSNIGTGEVQLYTGNQPVDAQAQGLAGFVNQVIKTGTNPAFSSLQLGVGTPSYYHNFKAEVGGATTNRNFSYYLGFLGYNQSNRFLDEFNGAGQLYRYGSQINYIAQGCGTIHASVGCYSPGNGASANLIGNLPLGPNGYALAPVYWGSIPSVADREGVANFHIEVPHAKDGLKDDIQFLYNTGENYNTPNDSLGSFNSALGDVLNGTVTQSNGVVIPNVGANGCPTAGGPAVACAAPVTVTYPDQLVYTGPLNTRLTAANLNQVRTLFFTGQNTSTGINGQVPFNQSDSETTGFSVQKVQYQHNFSTNAFARLYGYSFYSDRIDNGIVENYQNFLGGFVPDYLISAHTRGIVLDTQDQIDPHNLLQFAAGYNYTNSSRFNNSIGSENPVAYLVNSADPTAGCYSGTGTLVSCTAGTAARYRPSLAQGTLVPTKGAPTVGTEGSLTCGGAPCEYLAVGTGAGGTLNNVRPAFTNASIGDTIRPTDKLTVQAALRFDDYTYNLLQTNTLGNILLTNNYNNTHCVNGTLVATRAIGTPCPAGSAPTALTANSPAKEDYAHVFSPRLGLTYAVDPNTVIRASYGRFTQPAETSAVDATSLNPGPPSGLFYSNFGFNSYARFVEPEVSYNTDFSLEHALPKEDLQFSVSPFYRRTNNEFVSILVDPRTNFVANVNGLNRNVFGTELAVTKGNFARDGFAAQLAYTFTYATTKFKVFPNGGSFVASSNIAIQNYNAYTSYCAKNPKSNLCGATANGQPASPCYTPAVTDATGAITGGGVADPACAVGSIANPYYNSQPTGLLDPGASYFPYNINLGPGVNGGATSYVVPHVASLILNYKKGPFSISPSIQFQGGSRYGSPLVAQGVAPDACGGALATTTAGDPRYPVGAVGGAPYNASTCAAIISIPNPQSGHFDGIGEYVQPNLIATNVAANYDFSKRVGLNVIAANIFNRCFGGSRVPWNQGNIGCAYGQAGSYVGNVYNPGDAIQGFVQNSYAPVLGGALQSVSAGSPLPFQLFINVTLHT